MNMNNLLNSFLGTQKDASTGSKQNITNLLKNFSKGERFKDNTNKKSSKYQGAIGGLAAGGIVSMLVANKSSRKFAGKAAKLGGAALLGGLAYKLVKDWQSNSDIKAEDRFNEQQPVNTPTIENEYRHELTVIKAMIASAKADGHIDAAEQQRIFDAVNKLELPAEEKGIIFDLLSQPITIDDISRGVNSLEQKSEIYMASCFLADPNILLDRQHLDRLAQALALPQGLAQELESQAFQLAIE